MDFIFMLTRQDQTVVDCLEVFEDIRPFGLRHVGFKDVGVEKPVLRGLNQAIKAAGRHKLYGGRIDLARGGIAVCAHRQSRSASTACLAAPTWPAILAITKDSGIAYYPFPGKPIGHPTKLGGSPAMVEDQCKRFLTMGCAGVDLLAYRATEAKPLDLVKAARRGLGTEGGLICAGSVDSPARIAELKAAGCNAFTIGSAAFDGSFSPRKGRLIGQLQDILAAC